MSRKDRGPAKFSTWTGAPAEAPVELISVEPPKGLEVNGAPVEEQSHVYVVRKRKTDAED